MNKSLQILIDTSGFILKSVKWMFTLNPSDPMQKPDPQEINLRSIRKFLLKEWKYFLVNTKITMVVIFWLQLLKYTGVIT